MHVFFVDEVTMSKVLIVYGTTYGQTAKISDYISNELKKLNHTTEVYDSETVPVWVRG